MLTQALRRARHDESGTSIIEVVVASFILFFVLTAVLGLVGATTNASVSARQRTVMTNAIASYLEYARSLPFEAVQLSSVDASGALESVVTTTSQGFTVTLTTTVEDGPRRTREVQIAAVCSAPGHPTKHTSAFAAIRDHKRGMTLLPGELGPKVAFGGLTPPQNAVLYQSSVAEAGALYIDAQAKSDEGQITSLEFLADGFRLRDGYTNGAGSAFWTPGVQTYYQSFRWDTRQVDATSSPTIQDGWRLVRAEAVDDQGRHGRVERRFLVDNFAPNNPGLPRPMTSGWKDITVLLNWDPAQDGTEPAHRYELRTWRNVVGADSWGTWVGPGVFTLTQPAHTLGTSAFSRYWVQVRAYSPRGLSSGWVNCAGPFYSRPLATGSGKLTITGSGPTKTANVAVSLDTTAPAFPVWSVRYDVYRGTSLATLAPYMTGVTPPVAFTVSNLIGNKGTPIPYYFQFRVTFTPSGWGGGSPVTISSTALGPTPVVDDGLTHTLMTEW